MPEPEPARPHRGRRLRYSVRTLMGSIVALALVLAVLSPLYRSGLPPCMTPVETVTWLAAKPATASCMDCHSRSAALGWKRRQASKADDPFGSHVTDPCFVEDR
jgi:hypothetical protein